MTMYRVKILYLFFESILYQMKDDTLTKSILGCYTAENKICTFTHMLSLCNCSDATLRRRIHQNKLLVSYNHNSKFYTLSSFTDFNKFGIWAWQGVLFSRHGSLSRTCKVLVDNSKAGYTTKELTSILYVRVNDLLRIQSEKQLIIRERLGKEYIYYTTAPLLYMSQQEARRSIIYSLDKGQKGALPKKDTVIAILVAIISCERPDHGEVLHSLKTSNRQLEVSISDIEAVISHYGLKKTACK